MIKDLVGKYRFSQDDPVSRYFFDRNVTRNEIEKMNCFEAKMNDFAISAGIGASDCIYAEYLDGYGYYLLFDEDRGWYGLMPLGEDVEEAFYICANMTLRFVSHKKGR